MKAIKTAGLVVGAALVLLAAGTLALRPRLEQAVKTRLADAVLEKTQRRLAIDGLELSFGSAVNVRATGIALSERTGDAPFVRLASARLSLALLPLLSRRIVADAVELAGLRATLVRRADGTLNIDDLLALRGDGPPPRIDIGALRLADAELSWRDERTGRRLALGALALNTGRIADGAAGELDLSARLDAPGAEAAALRLSGAYRLDLARKAVALERAEARLAAPAFEARLALAGADISAAALAAARLELAVEARRDDMRLAARFASPLAVAFASGTLELPRLAGEVDLAAPARLRQPLHLPLSGTLAADWRRQRAELALAGRLDEATLSARATATRFVPPALRFALDIDRLDADRHLLTDGVPNKARRGAAPRLAPPDFAGLDVAGTVSIGRLSLARVEASDVRLRLGTSGGEGP